MAQNGTKEKDQPVAEDIDRGPGGFTQILLNTPSWLLSLMVHTVLLLGLALMTVDSSTQAIQVAEYIADAPIEEPIEEEPEEINIEIDPYAEVSPDAITSDVVAYSDVDAGPPSVEADEPAPAMVEVDPLAIGTLTPSNAGTAPSNVSGNGFGFRTQARRTAGVRGATTGSEAAVARGLVWLSLHQYPDGGWNFDHTHSPKCQGQCSSPGHAIKARNGATALGILPFLGCGITHKDGKTHKDVVKRGLYYLGNNIKLEAGKGGSFHEEAGTMYSHGLATICLTEAYGMTKDKALQKPAQEAVNFVVYAQDPGGGGWRYAPQQKGDTSVVGWQMMALKSGYMAYLKVPPETAKKAMLFLDSVQSNSGANYGYETPGHSDACTAIGLLCRMYYGWKKDNPALERGVEWISQRGPSGDMYYNYYATQVMHHYEGVLWKNWNNRMRDQLVDSQVSDQKSHEFGSWAPTGQSHTTEAGGRHCQTALSVMTLEVYYRHSPIYKKQTTEGGLPLE